MRHAIGDTSSRSIALSVERHAHRRAAAAVPSRVFSVVVLPAPLWPRNARIWPGSSANDTSEITVLAP